MDFPSFEEVRELLGECMDELPEVFFKELNLGVVLSEHAKPHPLRRGDDLYILGEYHRTRLGRQIVLYYGSFMKLFPYLPREQLKGRLRSTLRHEFRHHLEFLAGDYSLVRQDKEQLEQYLERSKQENNE
ncbi:MAG TPA: metallopeptidase family protein [Tissierellia bacterium]|jgi:predicted Zn-dependent protease with MMP-like domain|nr:metallopeptidase family protein [Tissierellia bacterium]